MIKFPPISKVYEAYSAIADQRITKEENKYYITSSDKTKTYTVIKDGNLYSSNDNATYWQHYAGYPIIASLMLEHVLDYQENLLEYFKNIPWKALNTKYKNNYDKSIEEAFSSLDNDTRMQIEKSCVEILEKLKSLEIQVKGNREPLTPKKQ